MELDIPDVFCIPIKDKKKGKWRLILKPLFGKGQYGLVYGACKREDCSYVMKVISLGKRTPVKSFIKEVEIQTELAAYNLTVPVEDRWICKEPKKVGVIIMRSLDITVKNFLMQDVTTKDIYAVIDGCRKIIDMIHDLGYFHGDNHLANIMMKRIRKDSDVPVAVETTIGTYQIYLIDLGKAGKLTEPGMIRGIPTTKQRRVKDDNVILNEEVKQVMVRIHPERIESVVL